LRSVKRTEITVEIDRLLIVRRRHSTRLWCRECGRETDFVSWEQMVKMEQGGRLLGTGARVAEPQPANSFHTQETRRERVLVCLESVRVFLTKSKPAKSEITTRPKPKQFRLGVVRLWPPYIRTK
jgi:hypothetical protein